MKSRTENKYYIFDGCRTYNLVWIVRTAYYMVSNFFYWILLMTAHRKQSEKKNKVSICAIFKNEAPYLKEWIEFHIIIGVNHFYMYNNNSNDGYLEILQPYIDNGIVTLIQWEKDQAQMEAYAHCIKNYSDETNWIGFIDLDEFIVPKKYSSIVDFLSQFERYPSVKLNWNVFGSSGKVDRNRDGLVTEDFYVSWNKVDEIGKCFYNTEYAFSPDSKRNGIFHHELWAKIGISDVPPVNCFHHICRHGFERADNADFPIVINHYFTKSFNEYVEKASKGDVYFVDNPHNLDYFYRHEELCMKSDYSAYKYLVKLKMRMKRDGE